jgi:hypothetical protein
MGKIQFCKALWDFEARDEAELSFKKVCHRNASEHSVLFCGVRLSLFLD